MKKDEIKQRLELRILVSLCIFIILFISILVSAILVYLLIEFRIIRFFNKDSLSFVYLILFMMITSWAIGGIISFVLLKIPLRPINYYISQINELTKGNFKTRLKKMPILPNHPTVLEITNSFNKLAEELENTEMLRSDFINNFSHEFKTPIVSIAGYAKLLKRSDLTDLQRKEYIDIIEKESLRLSAMATNVLNMTKVENQGILTNITKFNVSEQIRNSFLILEKKWIKKDIIFNIDFLEYEIEGNEELLKHVWINLIDNAIKFTSYKGQIEVSITQNEKDTVVSFMNSGSEISEDEIKKIFNKFYQIDQSHSTEGNGIGLSLVKKIVELHHGTIEVKSANNTTTFIVTLPNTQN